MFREYVKLAWYSLGHNKMRTVLSLLGIIIGVASVITIITLGQSASKSIQDEIAAVGTDTITIFSRTRDRDVLEEFTLGLGDKLKRNVNGISAVIPMNQYGTTIRYRETTTGGNVSGVTAEYASVLNYEAEEGRFFTDVENDSLRQVVVLGAAAAEELFPDGGAVDSFVQIYRGQEAKSYRVIGVMKEKSASFNLQFDQSFFIPFNTFSSRLRNMDYVQSYIIRAERDADVLQVSDNIESYLTRLVGEQSFNLFSPSTLAEMASNVTDTLSNVLASIAAISLLVGGIGIMNIMLVSVAERTREIGVRKAIGASPGNIMGQFLVEAMTITLIGGILGIILGIIISNTAVRFLEWSMTLNFGMYLLVAGFSIAVGVFFGWYPAQKAARLDPIEALNYE